MVYEVSLQSKLMPLLKRSLLLIIPILFFTVFFSTFDIQKTIDSLLSVPKTVFGASLLLTVPIFFMFTVCVHLMYRAAGYRLPFHHCFAAIIGAFPYNAFLPARTGDLFRVYYFHKQVPTWNESGNIACF